MIGIAAFPNSTQPRLVDTSEPPEPQPGEVLCRTLQLGVCGTDREILLSAAPALPPHENFLVLGHECLGRVERVGANVTELRVGDLVVPAVRRSLGRSPFRVDMLAIGEFVERGIYHEHGFSSPLWLDRPEHLFAVDRAIENVAVLAEPLAVAEKGVNEAFVIQQARLDAAAWITTPPRVLVTGLGPIAFAAVAACLCRRWPVTVYGRDKEDSFRAQLVAEFGATYVAPHHDPFRAADVEREGFDLVLECTGSDEVMLAAAQVLASRGIMVWLGSTRQPESRSHNVERLMRDGIIRNHLHIGTVNSAPRDFQDALQHLGQLQVSHPQQLAKLITARIAPRESLWHYEHRQPQGIKTVLMYDG